jgi:integrase
MIPTFAEFGALILEERVRNGIRGQSQEANRWKVHVATAAFADTPIDQIAAPAVAAWLRSMADKDAADKRGTRKISKHTIARSFSLMSAIFGEAGIQGHGHLTTNPCLGLKVKARPGDGTKKPWTYLTKAEIDAIRACAEIPDHQRWPILFAVATGLRQGEQFHLELADLHLDGPSPHVVVRFGSKGKAPKSGKIREVPLLPLAIEAAREWLAMLPDFCPSNHEGLVFPWHTGSRRGVGKPLGPGLRVRGTRMFVEPYKLALRTAGIERNVRWHDLRHTAASSLVMGYWGRRWSLEEIRDFMGHSSVTMTEKYAHLGVTALREAAAETSAAVRATEVPVECMPVEEPTTLRELAALAWKRLTAVKELPGVA